MALLAMLFSLTVTAQLPPVLLEKRTETERIALGEQIWRFHPGDSAGWASPGYNDGHWGSLAGTSFGMGK